MMIHKTCIHELFIHTIWKIRFDSLVLHVVVFLSSVYLRSYRCLNMGNLRIDNGGLALISLRLTLLLIAS